MRASCCALFVGVFALSLATTEMWVFDAAAQSCQIQSAGSQARLQNTCGGHPTLPGPSGPAPGSPPASPGTPPSSPSTGESIVLRFQTPGDPTSSTPIKVFQIDGAQIDSAIGRPITTSLIRKWKGRIDRLKNILKMKLDQFVQSEDLPIGINIKIKRIKYDADPFSVSFVTEESGVTLSTTEIKARAIIDIDPGLVSIITVPLFCFDPKVKVDIGVSISGEFDFLTGTLGNFDARVEGPDADASCGISLSPLQPVLDILARIIAEPLVAKHVHKLLEDFEDTQIQSAFGLNDVETIIPRISDPALRDIAQQAFSLLRSALSKGSGMVIQLTFDQDFFGSNKHALITEVRQQSVSGVLETFRASRVLQVTDFHGASLFDIYFRGSEQSPWILWKTDVNLGFLSLGWIPPGAGIMIVSYNRLIPALRSRPSIFIAGGPAYPGGAK